MEQIADKETEKEVIQKLRELHPDVPMLVFKKSFHRFGKKTDQATLNQVVEDARRNSGSGYLINKKVALSTMH
jgi:hypothetical protein